MGFNDQIRALTEVLKNEDLQKYAADSFLSLVEAVFTKDPFTAIDAARNIREMLYNMPNLLFWDKMKRFMYGSFSNYEEQMKMAQKFESDSDEYFKFVKKQVYLIDQIDDDEKVDYFACLTRAFLLECIIEKSLYFKLAKYLVMCTADELDFLKNCAFSYASQNTAMISALHQYGLFTQKTNEQGEASYILSDFGIALKQNCLNFEEGIGNEKRISSYSEIKPISLPEPTSVDALEAMFGGNEIVLNAGNASSNSGMSNTRPTGMVSLEGAKLLADRQSKRQLHAVTEELSKI